MEKLTKNSEEMLQMMKQLTKEVKTDGLLTDEFLDGQTEFDDLDDLEDKAVREFFLKNITKE